MVLDAAGRLCDGLTIETEAAMTTNHQHLTGTAAASHLATLKALADKYEANKAAKFGFVVRDVTPAGYGPKE